MLVALAALFAGACVGAGEVVTDASAEQSATTSAATASAEDATTTHAPTTTAPTTTAAPTTAAPTTEPPDPIEIALDGMDVETKVGQLIMPVLAGTSVDEASASNRALAGVDTIGDAVEAFGLGGVIYLGPNVTSAQQLTALSAGIQDRSQRRTPGIGALIAVDQEGGRVNRIRDGVEVFPSARSFGGDADAVRAAAAETARGVVAQGVNIVLAPVADLTDGNAGVIGNRSFSADPIVAAELVVASVEGLQSNGVAAAVKHWPGHGDTTLDSHRVLPFIEVDRELWEQRERVPFAAAVERDVAIVMAGHLSLPGLDPSGAPATVSSVLIDELLRSDLGFDGIVMTDALDMGAVEDQDRAELAVQSIEAGVDILLAPPDIAAAHGGVVAAVASGRISIDRLDASVRRVLELKDRLGLLDLPDS